MAADHTVLVVERAVHEEGGRPLVLGMLAPEVEPFAFEGAGGDHRPWPLAPLDVGSESMESAGRKTIRAYTYETVTVRVELLGPPAVVVDGERVSLEMHRKSALLCRLAYGSTWITRGEAMALFWPDVQESRARNRFRQLLLETRRSFPFVDIESRGDGIRCRLASDVAEQREVESDALLVEANSGWFLEGFRLDGVPEFDAWAASERAALHARWREAALRLSDGLIEDKRITDALEVLERVATRDPLDEEVAQRQIALLREIHPGRAARRYRAFADALDRELGAQPAAETRALIDGSEAHLHHPERGSANENADSGPLPVGATPFIGREVELREAAALLLREECRLLTVFAPGGMGKTRLALELGRRISADFAGGTVFVPLVHTRDTLAALAAIAEAMGVTVYGPRPMQRQIAAALDGQPRLLILDNVEQLDLGDELSELVELAPCLTVLVTSRRRLGIRAEWSFPLAGLKRPPSVFGADLPDIDLEAWDATRLFVQHAKQLRRGIHLDEAQRRAIARIASRVGGMPLALELAARWAGVLQPTAIDEGLDARKGSEPREDPLADVAQFAESRHRSVEYVLGESWHRLDEHLRSALRRLSVLRGFTGSAARAVAGVEAATLHALVDRAFVMNAEGAGSLRFDMHPMVQSFCADRAAEHPTEREASVDALARHYLGWAADANDRILSPEFVDLLPRFYADMGNFETAWRHAADRGFVDLLGDALKPLECAFRSRTWYRPWGQLVRYALERVDPDSLTHARLDMVSAANALDLQDLDVARKMGEAVLPRIDTRAPERHARINPHPAAEVRRILGHIALAQDRPDHAVARFEAALEILQRDGIDPYFEARLADFLGTAKVAAGATEEGRRWLLRAVRAMRTLRDPGCLAVAASNLARLELHTGSLDRALQLSAEALRIERDLNGRLRFFVDHLRTASDAYRIAGRYAAAGALLREELEVLERTPMPDRARRVDDAHDRLGRMALLQGDLEAARRHVREALTPIACQLPILEGDPRRAAESCVRWLRQPQPPAYLTLDLDRIVDRAFVLNCSAEAALACGQSAAAVRAALFRAFGYARQRSLIREALRGSALMAWYHAEHGRIATAQKLLARIRRHRAVDPDLLHLVRRVTLRFGLDDEPAGVSSQPLAPLVEEALADVRRDVPEPPLA